LRSAGTCASGCPTATSRNSLTERGIEVDHVTIYRWVQRFTPLLADAARPCLHSVGDRWQVDETYLRVAGRWQYVYRAVDQFGQVIDVLASARRMQRRPAGSLSRRQRNSAPAHLHWRFRTCLASLLLPAALLGRHRLIIRRIPELFGRPELHARSAALIEHAGIADRQLAARRRRPQRRSGWHPPGSTPGIRGLLLLSPKEYILGRLRLPRLRGWLGASVPAAEGGLACASGVHMLPSWWRR
jgi:hypothetical protein